MFTEHSAAELFLRLKPEQVAFRLPVQAAVYAAGYLVERVLRVLVRERTQAPLVPEIDGNVETVRLLCHELRLLLERLTQYLQ